MHRYVAAAYKIFFSLPSPHFQKEQGILQERVSALELRCSELQISNRDSAEILDRERSSARSAEAARQQQQLAEEKGRSTLEAAAKEARTLLEGSNKKVNDLVIENEKLQQELAAAKAIPPPNPPKNTTEDPNIAQGLRDDISRLQNENGELVRKADTIEERYKNGDLVCLTFPNLHTIVN